MPFVTITFDGYADTTALLADSTTFDPIEQQLTDDAGVPGYNAGDITLDNAAFPPGGTKAMRYHYNHPGNGVNSISLERSFILPSPLQEVWSEWNIKWSANFSTDNALSYPNDHKLIFGDTEAAANFRWALYVGADGPPPHLIRAEVPMGGYPGDGPFYIAGSPQADPLWNNAWHQIRMHMKASTTDASNDGQFHIWVDGVQILSMTGFSITRNDATSNGDKITGFSFTHNKDDGPPNVDMYIWWGPIRVYNTNPGW